MVRLLALFRLRWVQVLLVLGVLGAAAGIWMLLHPAAFWLQPWRPEAQTVGNRYIFGGYPVEEDFKALHEQGVTTVISLLHPDLPYEAVLLGQERELAKQYGMKVLNFPMASILGQPFWSDYEASSKAAAKAALEQSGHVYIHCYLGLHRAARVIELLKAEANVAITAGRRADREPDRAALDRASRAFRENRMEDALRELQVIEKKTLDSDLLEGWTLYRLNRIDEASLRFAKVAVDSPDTVDAFNGLGFCDLRDGDLGDAEKHFASALRLQPDNVSATEGMGYVRFRQGRLQESRALLEQVLKNSPGNADARQMLERIDQRPATP